MKCPFCQSLENKVIDSRLSKDQDVIRRRRKCLSCGSRFTTYERIEESLPQVIKKDGRREPFDRQKILAGIKKACEKRPISADQIDAVVRRIEASLQDEEAREIPSTKIGEGVMRELHGLDQVAYVRFASVYREFKDLSEFMEQLKILLGDAGSGGASNA
ncbi:MAG: transcriptional repressor NrdR [Myxococcales bacterium]|nr:transcriptional repressor NrdR [Myxococcales bacterium]